MSHNDDLEFGVDLADAYKKQPDTERIPMVEDISAPG